MGLHVEKPKRKSAPRRTRQRTKGGIRVDDVGFIASRSPSPADDNEDENEKEQDENEQPTTRRVPVDDQLEMPEKRPPPQKKSRVLFSDSEDEQTMPIDTIDDNELEQQTNKPARKSLQTRILSSDEEGDEQPEPTTSVTQVEEIDDYDFI